VNGNLSAFEPAIGEDLQTSVKPTHPVKPIAHRCLTGAIWEELFEELTQRHSVARISTLWISEWRVSTRCAYDSLVSSEVLLRRAARGFCRYEFAAVRSHHWRGIDSGAHQEKRLPQYVPVERYTNR
jgi:hypothetical protein